MHIQHNWFYQHAPNEAKRIPIVTLSLPIHKTRYNKDKLCKHAIASWHTIDSAILNRLSTNRYKYETNNQQFELAWPTRELRFNFCEAITAVPTPCHLETPSPQSWRVTRVSDALSSSLNSGYSMCERDVASLLCVELGCWLEIRFAPSAAVVMLMSSNVEVNPMSCSGWPKCLTRSNIGNTSRYTEIGDTKIL